MDEVEIHLPLGAAMAFSSYMNMIARHPDILKMLFDREEREPPPQFVTDTNHHIAISLMQQVAKSPAFLEYNKSQKN
jgi:hypothetical protein